MQMQLVDKTQANEHKEKETMKTAVVEENSL
jgi:hypothetical protein